MYTKLEELIDQILEKPYHVIDILPDQVMKDCAGQYFAAEEYFRTDERLRPLRAKFASIILKLNCYYDLDVCFYPEEKWEKNPDPKTLEESIISMPQTKMARFVIEAEEAMIDLDGCDTYMTVFGAGDELLRRAQALAKAEGLFVR